jgi:hypothetical protein
MSKCLFLLLKVKAGHQKLFKFQLPQRRILQALCGEIFVCVIVPDSREIGKNYK